MVFGRFSLKFSVCSSRNGVQVSGLNEELGPHCM